MSTKLQAPKLTDMRPRLTVIGLGGAGGNAINNMIASGLQGVEFIAANTDAQALAGSSAEQRIQLGVNLTEGLGAGSKPEIGEAAAEEALEDIRAQIAGSHMVFIAAGMGGGTGTGAASVVARVAKELGVLAVGVVTKPFQFEGARRMRVAEAGIAELRKHVDTLIVIPNQNLFRIASPKTTFAEAFVLADKVLYSGVACIVDLIIKEGLINLDFADIRTVMSGMGTAMMGIGEAEGDRRATRAAEDAISNPLLDDVTLKGAKGLVLSIIGGRSLTLFEVDEAASRVRKEVDPDANIILGATFDETLGERVRVSIVASGMTRPGEQASTAPGGAGDAANRPPMAAQSPAAGLPPRTHEPVAGPAARPGGHASVEPSNLTRILSDAVATSQPMPAATQPQGETWRGPGDVVVKPSLPAFGQSPLPPPLPPMERGPRGDESAPFTPQPPNASRRGQSRVPPIEDFPSIGQQEYRAKTGQAGPYDAEEAPSPRVYAEPSAQPVRRKGFLERIGFGGGNAPKSPQYPQLDSNRSSQAPSRSSRSDPRATASGNGPRPSQSVEEAVLPEFFGREKSR